PAGEGGPPMSQLPATTDPDNWIDRVERPSSLRRRFDNALAAFLEERSGELRADDLAGAYQLIHRFVLADGKRLRPLFCFWGAHSSLVPGDDEALVRAA